MNKQEVLKRPFNVKLHNRTFSYYCEAVIYENGKIEYAVPSHQEKMLRVYAKMKGLTREQVNEIFYNDIDFFDKVLAETKLVLVWYHKIQYITMSEKQKESLKLLIDNKCIDLKGE